MSPKKYEKPVKLDMGFAEALERFATTNPKEITADEGDDGPLHLIQPDSDRPPVLIYQNEAGAQVQLRVEANTFWATQAQMAAMFGVEEHTITYHLGQVYGDGELDRTSTTRKIRGVRREGTRDVSREIEHHDLNALISVGYRVGGKPGTIFRMWATDKLFRYLSKGFVIDVQRLKSPDTPPDRVAELREIIKDIRADEANVYREVRALCATCKDYDPKSSAWRDFYARMQNKLFWATVSMTATHIRLDRANAANDNMGLVTGFGERVIQKHTLVAKNYLAGPEVERMNRLAVMLLDFIRDQLLEERIATMAEMEVALDGFIKQANRPLMPNRGIKIPTKTEADEHCKAQYKIFSALRAMHEDEGDTRALSRED